MTDFRRHDDDPIYERLQQLENKVSGLETKVNTLSLEQKHMLDLFGARFTTIERAQDLTISEVRSLNASIQAMASEATQSPAGRALLATFHDHQIAADAREDAIKTLQERQTQMDTVIGILRWMQLPGILALLWVALRAFGKAP